MKWLVLVSLIACVDRGPGAKGKKIDAAYIRQNVLAAAPADLDRVDVDLGGKVTYLGNKLGYPDNKDPKTPLAPGQAIRVTHYWQVKQPLGTDWRVFAFVRGAATSADYMSLDPTDMEQGLPPARWKPGQIIADIQDIVLRPDWRSPTATLSIGLVEQHGHQIGDRMAASGPPGKVVDRAILAREIAIDLAKAPPPAGTVYVPYKSGGITIDGMAIDPAWATAAMSPDFVPAGEGCGDPVGKASARMTWDEQNLYVFVQITDTDIFSPYKNHDEPVWKADCVEIFIDADGNRSGYIELQVSPNNATFDSWFATTRAQPGDEKWDSGMQTAVKVHGTPDKSGDTDSGWEAEIAIPLTAVKGRNDAMAVQIPPKVGDRWHLNVLRVDYRSGGGGPSPESWNRIGCSDFHALDRMLTVVFADRNGSITPGSDPAGAGSGSAAPPAAGSGSSAAQIIHAVPVPTPTPTPTATPVTPR